MEAYGFASAESGPQKYGFEIDLCGNIDVPESEKNVHLSGSQLSFVLKKSNAGMWWPRLTAQSTQSDWILIDEENWTSRVNKKMIYLFLYNLLQFGGYLFIFTVLVSSYFRDESVEKEIRNAGVVMKFCQIVQYLEVLHAIFGWTKGSPLYPFLQVTGRNFVLFCMIDAERSRVEVILMLFLCWSFIECVRYPYYVLSLIQCEIGFVTWLRYTLWIPLYPLGAFLEGMVVVQNIPFFEETHRFTITMPNKWNCTFCMCTFINFYLLSGLLPGVCFMMKHMSKVRKHKLRANTFKNE